MRKRVNLLLISLLFLSSCSFETAPIHKTYGGFQINKLGYINLENKSILNVTYPNANEIYLSTVTETLNEYILDSPKYFNINISYDKPDLKKIIELCQENDLDGFLMASLKFSYATYSVNYNPVGSSMEAVIELKIIDKEGDINTSVSQSILLSKTGNRLTSEQKIIHDGSKKAIKKITKLMGYKKVK
jgi:hypothetical protein